MNEPTVVLLNLVLYVVLFVFCVKKYTWHSMCSYLSLLYAIGATCSYLLFNFPLYKWTYSSNGTCSLESCIYLFVVNFLLITSFRNADIKNCCYLSNYNEKFLFQIQKLLCCVFIVILVFTLPDSISKFFSGRDLSEMRHEMYGANQSNFFFISLLNRFFGSSGILILCIACIRIVLLKKKSRWDYFSIVVYGLLKLNTICNVVSRATIVFSLLEIIAVIILFYSFIPRKLKRKIFIVGIIIGPVFYVMFSSISYARFGSSGVQEANLATLRYAGEANLNFMGIMYPDLKEPFHGYKEIPLFRRMVGLDYWDGKSRDGSSIYDTYISSHYHFPHPVYIFYGLAGSWFSNWGSGFTLLIAALVNYLMNRRSAKNELCSTFQFIMYIVMAAFIGKGIFYEDYRSESGNLFYLYLIVIYFVLKNKGRWVPILENRSRG